MVENHKVKALNEHGRQLDDRMQVLHQEFQDSISDNKRRWKEQAQYWNDKLNAQMETLMASIHIFITGKEAERDERNQVNSKGVVRLQ